MNVPRHRHLNEDQFGEDERTPTEGIGGAFDLKGDWEQTIPGNGGASFYTHHEHPGRQFTADEYMARTRHVKFDGSRY